MIELTTEVGRLVAGHPMNGQRVTDDNNQPKLGKDGQPMTEYYIGVAIPKGQEQDWKQTAWGQQIQAQAQAGYPNGEFNAPTFAWKIIDGDSTVPNKKGKIPNQREGWPGHWIMQMSTGIPIRCYHAGQYEPHQQIQEKNAIKTGDYCRVVLNCKANNPSPSPGVYLNPVLFELTRAGQMIAGSGPDAAAAFGGAAPQLPAGALVDTNIPSPAPQAAAPAPQVQQAAAPAPQVQQAAAPAPQIQTPAPAAPAQDFLNAAPAPAPAPVERKFHYNGAVYTEAQLRASNWDDAAINTLQPA